MSKSHTRSGWASDAPTPAQLKEFFAQINNGRVTKAKLQAFLRGETTELIIRVQQQVQEWGWTDFYKKYFGLDLDSYGIEIPEHQEGFDRLIIVAKGLTLNQVYDACAKQFPCWRYSNDLDKDVTKNGRDSKNGIYAIWVRDRQEADEENKNISADDLAEQKMPGITLLERMLYELKYWDETQKHLDMYNVSLCSGSRRSDGDMPRAYWDDGKFKVYWNCPNYRNDDLRTRSVVFLPAEPSEAQVKQA